MGISSGSLHPQNALLLLIINLVLICWKSPTKLLPHHLLSFLLLAHTSSKLLSSLPPPSHHSIASIAVYCVCNLLPSNFGQQRITHKMHHCNPEPPSPQKSFTDIIICHAVNGLCFIISFYLCLPNFHHEFRVYWDSPISFKYLQWLTNQSHVCPILVSIFYFLALWKCNIYNFYLIFMIFYFYHVLLQYCCFQFPVQSQLSWVQASSIHIYLVFIHSIQHKY